MLMFMRISVMWESCTILKTFNIYCCRWRNIGLFSHTNGNGYGHVLQKEDNDWVKKCMEYELESSRPRGRPKKTWREIVEIDCQARKLNSEDAMDRNRWRKQIRDD